MKEKEVKLVEFQNDMLAEMVKNVLTEKEIFFRAKSDIIQSALIVEGNAASGAFTIIYVKEKDLQKAQDAIAGMV
jgi:Putative prokaryotic signal transducing protein